MSVRWILGLLFLVCVSVPFWLSDNTGRSYLSYHDLYDPATVVHAYQRVLHDVGLSESHEERAEGKIHKRVDEFGVVHYSDGYKASNEEIGNSEIVDLKQIKNANFVAMDGMGDGYKKFLVYAGIALVLLVAAWMLWRTLRAAGAKVTEGLAGSSHEIPRQEPLQALEYSSANGHYAVLGVAENASDEEIKLAYRKKMSQFHPDKVAMMDEKVRDSALKQAQLINAAYKSLVKDIA